MKALSFGEILWDVYPDRKYIGGAPLNFAAHLSKHGEQVYMLSAVGDDELGRDAVSCLKKWGCRTEYISVLQGCPTGCCTVTLDGNSVPGYRLLEDVAYDRIPYQAMPDDFDLLYFGTLALRSKENFAVLSRLLRENHFPEILVDANVREPFCSKAAVRFAVEKATVLKISAEELPIVAAYLGLPGLTDYTACVKELSRLYSNLNCIVCTRGADGAYALDCKSGEEYSCPAVKGKVISTVGAGDSFSAAFIYWYLRRKDIPYCLHYASRIAGYVVSEYDAVPDYTTEDFTV